MSDDLVVYGGFYNDGGIMVGFIIMVGDQGIIVMAECGGDMVGRCRIWSEHGRIYHDGGIIEGVIFIVDMSDSYL